MVDMFTKGFVIGQYLCKIDASTILINTQTQNLKISNKRF